MYVCGVYIDDGVVAQASAAADAAGCPRGLVVGLGIIESGGNPDVAPAVDTNGLYSVGFLSLNQGGQGAGFSVPYLQNFANNLAIGVPPIAAAYQAYGTDWWSVMQAAGHPGWVGGITSPITVGGITYTLGDYLTDVWTVWTRPDLGMSPLAFVACAVQQLSNVVAPPVYTPPPTPLPPYGGPLPHTPPHGPSGRAAGSLFVPGAILVASAAVVAWELARRADVPLG